MSKTGIILDLAGFEVFDSVPTKFGNGAHVLISKEYCKRKLKVIVGAPVKVRNNKINIDFFGHEILERKASKFGTGFHIIVPKNHIGKKIKIIVGGEK